MTNHAKRCMCDGCVYARRMKAESSPAPLLGRPYPRASRASDPETSRKAEATITASGKRGTQTDRVADVVRALPGNTSAEYAKFESLNMDRYQVARRLPDAEALGFVRKGGVRRCTVTLSDSVTWWPAGG